MRSPEERIVEDMPTPSASRRVAIVGSNGIYAQYGGWDQLVNNLAERKSDGIEYLIFNARDTPDPKSLPAGVVVRHLPLRASGFEGLFFDAWSILECLWRVDTMLLLGVQGIPLLVLLRWVWKPVIVSNVGGIEWERPKFGLAARLYLRFCFWLSLRWSSTVILDNQHHRQYLPARYRARVIVIPYGGVIDTTLEADETLKERYPFLCGTYFLSVSRSLEDNRLGELCAAFAGSRHALVLISNFSKTEYGRSVLARYRDAGNVTLIDGLYYKPELDLIRRKCAAYVHTHTLCGTAPSLVEMVIARRPILSIDVPQNRFTLEESGFFFTDFDRLIALLDSGPDLSAYVPPDDLARSYAWDLIVRRYEDEYRGAAVDA